MASTFAEASLKSHSALKQEVVSLREQLSAAVPASSVDAESKLASILQKLTASKVMIIKLRAGVQTGSDQVENIRHRASD